MTAPDISEITPVRPDRDLLHFTLSSQTFDGIFQPDLSLKAVDSDTDDGFYVTEVAYNLQLSIGLFQDVGHTTTKNNLS